MPDGSKKDPSLKAAPRRLWAVQQQHWLTNSILGLKIPSICYSPQGITKETPQDTGKTSQTEPFSLPTNDLLLSAIAAPKFPIKSLQNPIKII